MAKYFEKSAVMAILNTFGDEDVSNAVSHLTEYNDDANKIEYGMWQDVEQWQVFSPYISTSDSHYVIDLRKVILHQATCSNCHSSITIDDYDNYCPRCGAKMSYAEQS